MDNVIKKNNHKFSEFAYRSSKATVNFFRFLVKLKINVGIC